jgi:hypothetical protein
MRGVVFCALSPRPTNPWSASPWVALAAVGSTVRMPQFVAACPRTGCIWIVDSLMRPHRVEDADRLIHVLYRVGFRPTDRSFELHLVPLKGTRDDLIGGLAVDSVGDVYVSYPADHKVWRYDARVGAWHTIGTGVRNDRDPRPEFDADAAGADSCAVRLDAPSLLLPIMGGRFILILEANHSYRCYSPATRGVFTLRRVRQLDPVILVSVTVAEPSPASGTIGLVGLGLDRALFVVELWPAIAELSAIISVCGGFPHAVASVMAGYCWVDEHEGRAFDATELAAFSSGVASYVLFLLAVDQFRTYRSNRAQLMVSNAVDDDEPMYLGINGPTTARSSLWDGTSVSSLSKPAIRPTAHDRRGLSLDERLSHATDDSDDDNNLAGVADLLDDELEPPPSSLPRPPIAHTPTTATAAFAARPPPPATERAPPSTERAPPTCERDPPNGAIVFVSLPCISF